MADPAVQRLIIEEAQKRGLDPAAVLAVASTEGGIRYGAVGDSGTSFGPFQLHVGGALPAGRGASFANSPEGIAYALDSMVKAGAGGLTGQSAVEAIVRKFERPADPASQIAKAVSRLGQFGNAPTPPPTQSAQRAAEAFNTGPAGVVAGPNPAQEMFLRQQQAGQLLALGQAAVNGQLGPDAAGQALLATASAYRRLQSATQRVAVTEAKAQEYGGTTIPTAPPEVPADGSDKLAKVIDVASQQIGKPYVWGAETPAEGGFDCSGLIDYAYRQAGINLPVGRLTTYTALKLGFSVKGQPLRAGDMLITNGGKHMVMYTGNGQVIAAPHRGEVVQYQPVSRFDGDIVDVRRILK